MTCFIVMMRDFDGPPYIYAVILERDRMEAWVREYESKWIDEDFWVEEHHVIFPSLGA